VTIERKLSIFILDIESNKKIQTKGPIHYPAKSIDHFTSYRCVVK
jgi:hypothetical protein